MNVATRPKGTLTALEDVHVPATKAGALQQ